VQSFEAKIGFLEASNRELQAILAAKDRDIAVLNMKIAELGTRQPDEDFASE
jgi:hypothetical protein